VCTKFSPGGYGRVYTQTLSKGGTHEQYGRDTIVPTTIELIKTELAHQTRAVFARGIL
jgi:hypothetical protein